MRASEFVSEVKGHDFMAGHCHVMAIALKQLHPDWQIRAHVGYDDDEADDTEYRVDHVYTVAPDGTAYDCRGRFDNEQQLVGPDTTGGVDTQYVNFGPEEIKQAMLRGELKRFTKQDLANAMQVATQAGKQGMAEGLTEYKNTPLQDYNGLQFMIDSNHPYLRVKAFAPGSGQQLAQVDFKIDDQDELHPEDLHVEERWRGQGIAQIMYDFVKSKGYTIHRSWSQTDAGAGFWDKHRGEERVWEQGVAKDSLTEIENMDQSYFRGGKDTLDRYSTPGKKHLRALPGGSDLMYSITSDAHGSYVHIVEPGLPGITKPSIVASLSLVEGVIPDSVQVGAITVDEDYRGRGLAKALYGIVLTIMKKTLISGSSQTPGGRRNWLSLASIPGVEIKGLLDLANFQLEKSRQLDNTMDQLMQLGGQFVARDNNYTYWAFDVVPGNGQLAPAVKNKLSKLYGYDSTNLLMATWTGGQPGVAESKQPGKSVTDAILKVMPIAQEIWFHGSRATGSHRKNSDTDILVIVPDDLVGDQYLGAVRILQKLSTHFDNHDIQPTKAETNIHRIAQEEGQLLWSNKQSVAENFADGRNPQDKGDSKRHGINTKASVSSLRKTAKQGGRKGQLAHWLANMKSGRAKKKKTNETVIGTLHFPKLIIAVDDHAIDRTRTRGISPATIDQSLRKLNSIADQLGQMESSNTVWVYDVSNNLALGLRRTSSRDMRFTLKTVVADRPYDGTTPIIELTS